MKKILIAMLILIMIGGVVFYYVNSSRFSGAENLQLESNENIEDDSDNIELDNDSINEEAITRIDDQGAVDVAVTFNNLVKPDKNNLVFKMYFNTHSVELDQIDFAKLAFLKSSDGIEVKEGFQWQPIGGSGHHIYGHLILPRDYKGQRIINDNTEYIELEIRNLANIASRHFKWEREVLEPFE